MMSQVEFLQNYFQYFVIAPIVLLFKSTFSLKTRVKVNETKIEKLEASLADICKKHDTTNNLLRELLGAYNATHKT